MKIHSPFAGTFSFSSGRPFQRTQDQKIKGEKIVAELLPTTLPFWQVEWKTFSRPRPSYGTCNAKCQGYCIHLVDWFTALTIIIPITT